MNATTHWSRRMAALLGGLLLIAQAPARAAVEYIHTDSLGTPVAITDSDGNVVQTSEYEPYGKLLNRQLTDAPGYSGHETDATTGMVYMQQRYYDPGIGRFLSVDPVAADSCVGGNFNRYWYANNSPYRFNDPDGRIGVDVVFVAYDIYMLATEGATATNLVATGLDVASTFGFGFGAGEIYRGVHAAEVAAHAVEGASHAAETTRGAEKAVGAATKGETAATKAGRQAHKDWYAGEGFEKEVRLKNGKQADAVNFETKHVKELKPDNARAVRRGEKQVEGYRQQLEKQEGGKWTSSVETYKRTP